MPSERVLIVGAGVAGSVLAFFLAKSDYEVVVIERSKAEQKLGQGIEIEEPAIQVVKEMGILDELRAIKTTEMGFTLENQNSGSYGTWEIGAASPTGELELMRGDLTEVLYKAADKSPQVTCRFETTIQALTQTHDKVTVDLENRVTKTTTTETFDFVIGADGARSRTRNLVFGPPEQLDCFKPVGAFVAYFSIPKQPQDLPYARLCQFPNRRVVWTRPVAKDSDVTSVYLIHVNDNNPSLREANISGDRTKQKQAFADIYNGLGWETPRVIEQMMRAENFYFDELMQVKLPSWSQNRVVLVGDSAWAPTPFTGQGNQLAIIGAWVLAQEMARNRDTAAFGNYEKRLRAYVEESQKIPLGGWAPYMCCPQTSLGIWLFRTVYQVGVWVNRWLASGGSTSSSAQRVEHPFDLELERGFN